MASFSKTQLNAMNKPEVISLFLKYQEENEHLTEIKNKLEGINNRFNLEES